MIRALMQELLNRLFARPRSLGDRGERFAARWLRKRGYRILERNLTIGKDEIDLIVLTPDRTTIALVEVKTRRDDRSPPESHVDGTKQHRLSRLAANLQKRRPYSEHPMRFDVIAVIWPDGEQPIVRHSENAFESTI